MLCVGLRRGSHLVVYLTFRSVPAYGSLPPRHSVTLSPVISRCKPPPQTSAASQISKNLSSSLIILSNLRVFCPSTVSLLACRGSSIHTTGYLPLLTSSSS